MTSMVVRENEQHPINQEAAHKHYQHHRYRRHAVAIGGLAAKAGHAVEVMSRDATVCV